MAMGEMFQVPTDAYDRHVGRYSTALARALIDVAGVEGSTRVLDVGCGPGALTAALAERVGQDAVSAVDPSPPFADACRTRVPSAEVSVGRAEELPFPDDTFDATLSQLVVNFMADPPAGVREMARVTRPGGIVASAVWDYAGEMTLLRAFWDAAKEVDPQRGAALDEGAVMPWCGDGDLAKLWSQTDLADVRFGPLAVEADYAGFDDLWSPFPAGVGPSGAYCESLSLEQQTALRAAYRRLLGVGDEPFRLTARAWAAVGFVT
jgi:SAM-dependent methyltransferase